jgi:hypothetical protein
MRYVKIINGKIEKYPYIDLQKDNPNTSFSFPISEEILAMYDVYVVHETQKPTLTHFENTVEETPKLVDGKWFQCWKVVKCTDEEKEAIIQNEWDKIRKKRNELLQKTDWMVLPDSPADKDDAAQYRKKLRSITDDFTDPFEVVWPSLTKNKYKDIIK